MSQVYGLTNEHKRQLQKLALELLGKPSISALMRWLAERGEIENVEVSPSDKPSLKRVRLTVWGTLFDD